ncbi:hypothetical protein GQ457_05G004300 [Hibiscus cannabinus]
MAKENKPRKIPHVLINPSQGHINTILQFVKHLLFKDVKPAIVITVFLFNSSFSDLSSTSIDLYNISDAYLPIFWSVGPKSFAALIKKLGETGHPVDALIYDGFMPWALDVAK